LWITLSLYSRRKKEEGRRKKEEGRRKKALRLGLGQKEGRCNKINGLCNEERQYVQTVPLYTIAIPLEFLNF
jgi:hypothetical protein